MCVYMYVRICMHAYLKSVCVCVCVYMYIYINVLRYKKLYFDIYCVCVFVCVANYNYLSLSVKVIEQQKYKFYNLILSFTELYHMIDPSWGGPIELFLVPASAPRLV